MNNTVKGNHPRATTEDSRARQEKQPSRRGFERRGSASRGMEKHTMEKPSDHQRRARPSSRSRASSRPEQPLEASSFHVTGSRAVAASRVRRSGPNRHKSYDNVELRGGGGRDDLGAATLHGGNSVSRIRGGTKSSRNLSLDQHLSGGSCHGPSTNSSKRPQMKRAMSNDNVTPPEEYARGVMQEPKPVVRRGGRRRPTKQPEPAVVEEEEEEEEVEEEDNVSSSSDESGSSFGEEEDDDDDDSDGEDSFENASPQKSPHKRGTVDRASSSSKQPQQQQQPETTTPKRAGLLQLMRDEQTIVLSDLQDKKNRRVLHFLLYQHKLGIDMAQLQQDIHDDIATNGVEQALSRPVLPLYVEPAN